MCFQMKIKSDLKTICFGVFNMKYQIVFHIYLMELNGKTACFKECLINVLLKYKTPDYFEIKFLTSS